MEELKKRIREILERRGSRPVRLEEVMRELGLPSTDRKRVRRLMRDMAGEGDVARMRGGRFQNPGKMETVVGILRTSTKGFGFVVPEACVIEGKEQADIFVSRRNMEDAMNNDKVLVRITGRTEKSPEGEILKVLERGTNEIVGTFYYTKRGGHVLPRDEHFNRTVITPRPHPDLGVEDGSYVLAEVTQWTHATEPLLGRVREVLGDVDTPGIDITMIIRDAGVEPEFPADVLREAEEIPEQIPQEEIDGRTDFRDIVTVTMDGFTAKDFDDALSIEMTDEGLYRLGVHIADVAHYVREETPLDMEAYERATSIYPIDRVVPMLPEKLSNGLCSLRPDEDRLTMSCVMEIDNRGRVHHYSVHNGIIRSRHRLVYEQVQEVMDGTAEPELMRRIGSIRPQLEMLYDLRKILTAMRMRRGALDLDIPETEVLFHENGIVKGLARRPRMESHRVVEECMLIANEVVASHLFNLHVPSVYRVHESPDLNKLRRLMPVLAHLGIRFPAKAEITPEAIQSALDKAAKMEIGFIARRLILRSMMRAHYHDENLGHYGLASECYTHFTSPIRRYPDLLVHRLLKETIRNGAPTEAMYSPPGEPMPEQGMVGKPRISLRQPPPMDKKRLEFWQNSLSEKTTHCSERERRAEDIERDAAKVKALEYMRAFIGDEFDGYVISVLNWGIFVELIDMPIEGLVHIRNLKDDYYEYDEDHMTLVGRETGRTFKLGDRVRIQVDNVNLLSLELDFLLSEKYVPEGSAEKIADRHRQKKGREERHAGRQPKTGGFQARGRRRTRR